MMLPLRQDNALADVIFPERTEYIPSVTCSGTVGYSQVRSIKEEIPLIIKEYLVNVGDRVDQGQTIAVVDKQAVCDKLSNIYSGSVSDVGRRQNFPTGYLRKQWLCIRTHAICKKRRAYRCRSGYCKGRRQRRTCAECCCA